jgi:hypothetical protein
MGGLVDASTWPYISEGYQDPEKMIEMLRVTKTDYLIDRPEQKYWSLQATVRKYPQHFEHLIDIGFEEGNPFFVYRFWPSAGARNSTAGEPERI